MGRLVLDDVRLEGERIVLRPIEVGDVDLAFEQVHGRSEILDWLTWTGPGSRDELVPFYSRWRLGDRKGHDYHLAVVGRDDGRFSGCVGVRFQGHPRSGDVGYWIAVDRWGRGYATEAVRLASWLCFARLQSVLLYASVFVGNDASRRALEKNGYSLDHVSAPLCEGQPREKWHLSLTRTGFREAFAGFEPRAAEVEVSEVG